jgi:hypothetical protein
MRSMPRHLLSTGVIGVTSDTGNAVTPKTRSYHVEIVKVGESVIHVDLHCVKVEFGLQRDRQLVHIHRLILQFKTSRSHLETKEALSNDLQEPRKNSNRNRQA